MSLTNAELREGMNTAAWLQSPDGEECGDIAAFSLSEQEEMARELLSRREAESKTEAENAELRGKLESVKREADETADKAADRSWLDGALFGWNCGVSDDSRTFDRTVEARRNQQRADAALEGK